MADFTSSPGAAGTNFRISAPNYDSNTPTYGVHNSDGTFFNNMLNVPEPALLAKDIAENAGKITKEMAEETKRNMRESAEISKAGLATRLYISEQQLAVSLAKEAIEVTKQA
jgi:hypothetical protein